MTIKIIGVAGEGGVVGRERELVSPYLFDSATHHTYSLFLARLVYL